MKMRTVAAIAAFLAETGQAHAEVPMWVAATSGNDGTAMYFDGASLKRRKDGTLSVWVKTAKPSTFQTYASTVQHDLVRCDDRERVTRTSLSFYDSNGAVLQSDDTVLEKDLIPGSLLDGALETACAAIGFKAH